MPAEAGRGAAAGPAEKKWHYFMLGGKRAIPSTRSKAAGPESFTVVSARHRNAERLAFALRGGIMLPDDGVSNPGFALWRSGCVSTAYFALLVL